MPSASSSFLQPRDTSLNAFHSPASVAVVGASADHAKWGHWLAKGAASASHRRAVYLVNPRSSEICGLPCYPTLAELPETPELIAIAVPGEAVYEVIAEGLRLGTRAFLVVAAAITREAEVCELLTRHGARMIGPNSLGIYAADGELQLMWGQMQPGSLALISQSGQLGSEIAAIGARHQLGISRFVSLGNQSNVGAAEMIRAVIHDTRTRTIALYLEDFSCAQELFPAIREASAADRPVLLLTTGESAASQDLAHSHTGAMTSSLDLVDAACRAAGALRVHTPTELVQLAAYLEHRNPPGGSRIAVITDSGGQGGIAADTAARLGLEPPLLSERLRAQLSAWLPASASTRNPIDLAGAGEANLAVYAELPRILAESGEVDAVVLSGYFGSYGHDMPQLLAAEREVATALAEISAVPVVVHAMAPESQLSAQLVESGVPVVSRIEDAMRTLAGAARLRRNSAAHHHSAAAATPAADRAPITISARNQLELREALATAGIPFPQARVIRTAEEAAAAAAELGGTVVLKAAWLAHKTEDQGVQLGLRGEAATAEAFREMHARLGEGTYTIETQDLRDEATEYIVSARQDPHFGPVISVGFGGTETEIWQDLRTECAPVDPGQADAMLTELRSARLLEPWRGRAALDRAALAQVVSRLSRVLIGSPTILEVELNPVRVGCDGALAVDCFARFTAHSPSTGRK